MTFLDSHAHVDRDAQTDVRPPFDHGAAALPRPEDVPVRELLGLPIAMTDYGSAMDVMDGMIARRQRGYVCATAVHAVMVAQTDDEMRDAIQGATLTVPDGMPLVWAAKLLGEGVDDRVYGPELMLRHCERSRDKGHRIFLYGGRDQGSLAQLALNLRMQFPGIQIVGGYSPPFRPLTAEEDDAVADQINAARPDIVWVGIGVPKQEKWMARMRDRIEAPVLAAVGAAFDFHAGRVSMAPGWMQDRGLEWIYRLAQEPRRLLPRYVIYNPRFVLRIAKQLARERLLRRRALS
jgi:N-acetylglucosaminyldiphosphoundecaprenol N-acetyl-beta-D-mannosaminyltransferase